MDDELQARVIRAQPESGAQNVFKMHFYRCNHQKAGKSAGVGTKWLEKGSDNPSLIRDKLYENLMFPFRFYVNASSRYYRAAYARVKS